MAARYNTDLHLAFGQIPPTQRRIQGQMGQQLHVRAEQGYWYGHRRRLIVSQRPQMRFEQRDVLCRAAVKVEHVSGMRSNATHHFRPSQQCSPHVSKSVAGGDLGNFIANAAW